MIWGSKKWTYIFSNLFSTIHGVGSYQFCLTPMWCWNSPIYQRTNKFRSMDDTFLRYGSNLKVFIFQHCYIAYFVFHTIYQIFSKKIFFWVWYLSVNIGKSLSAPSVTVGWLTDVTALSRNGCTDTEQWDSTTNSATLKLYSATTHL